MRHRHSRLRLNKKPKHAAMVLRNLATSLLLYESIRTTEKQAQVVRPLVERLVRVAREKTEREAIRSIHRVVTDEKACRKLIEVYRGTDTGKAGGLTRITSLGARKGDGASLVEISLRSPKKV
ncbi:50S ribosomal protein L17 [Candidatus Peregrinibacteria bacterium]|nr:50S ribosomal protein L17 [Candidatus Peregrinibacteria bacterium]